EKIDALLPFLQPAHVVVERRACLAVRRLREQELEEPFAIRAVRLEQPFLQHRPEVLPESAVFLGFVAAHLVERREHALHELFFDDLDLAILLQNLARDVEREIVRIDYAAHETEPARDEILALVEDEDALHVELNAALHLGAVEIERRL